MLNKTFSTGLGKTQTLKNSKSLKYNFFKTLKKLKSQISQFLKFFRCPCL